MLAYDADTDPNEVVGQPHEYVEKVNFADGGLAAPSASDTNGTVEVFATPIDAAKRKLYMDDFTKQAPSAAFHTYQLGRYVLRITTQIDETRAKAFQQAFVIALESGAVPSPIPTTALPAEEPTPHLFTLAFVKAKWLTPKEREYLVAVNDSLPRYPSARVTRLQNWAA